MSFFSDRALKSVGTKKGKDRVYDLLGAPVAWIPLTSVSALFPVLLFRRGCSLLGKLPPSCMKEALMLGLTFILEVMVLLPTLPIPRYQWHCGTRELNKVKDFATFFNAPGSQLINREQCRLGYMLLLLWLVDLILVGLHTWQPKSMCWQGTRIIGYPIPKF